MNKLIVYANSSEKTLSTYQLRQGLAPVFAHSLPSLRARSSNLYYKGLKVSPDGTKIIVAHTDNIYTPSNKFWVSDLFNPQTEQSLTYFDGSILTVDISNTHYAVGGNNPALLLYNYQGHTAIPINTLGLGKVLSVCFNKNGSKLFVLHDKSPYLRVYHINDLSFYDTSVQIGISSYPILYSIDDKLLFFGKINNSYFKVFDESLTQILSYDKNNLALRDGYIPITPLFSPTKENVLWIFYNKKEVYELDYITGELSKLANLDYNANITYDIITDNEFLYISHNLWENRNISVYNINDLSFNANITDCFFSCAGNVHDMIVAKSQPNQITGIVRDINNTVASRTVRAYDRKTGELVAQTKSNAQGEYTLELPNQDPVDVQFMAQDGELLNDLFYANVTPKPV